MPLPEPLILGAGPAGCAAAIILAQAGARPLLIDRQASVGDALCGGFLSWRTVRQLNALGVEPVALGAPRIDRLVVFGGGRQAEVHLPSPALALSRRASDTALRERALALGARLTIDRIVRIDPAELIGQERAYPYQSLFLACGKHDVRGAARPRAEADPSLGLRIRVRPGAALARMLADRIELHLFEGGYAGIVLQEDGTANICLALRKSRLAQAGGDPAALFAKLADASPSLAERFAAPPAGTVQSIAGVPYGWRAARTRSGLFRLGDQAAVIPSLAGEGIAIALASGTRAARDWLVGGPAAAPPFQRRFSRSARVPLAVASGLRNMAERPLPARAMTALIDAAPALARLAAGLTRIG